MLWWVIIPTYPYFLLMNLKYIAYIPNYISTIHAIAYDFPSRKAKKDTSCHQWPFQEPGMGGFGEKGSRISIKTLTYRLV